MCKAPCQAGPPRVAIACSGLGHISRGIEAWAQDLAAALADRGVAVTLFGGGASGPGRPVPCLRRGDPATRALVRIFRRLGGWRYGFGSTYELEQLTFAAHLWRQIHAGYDILHVQDPLVARCLDFAHRRGWSRARVILANGTDEAPATLARLTHLQELTPDAADAWQTRPVRPLTVHAIPNFVDTAAYTPGDAAAARRALDLPPDGQIVLCCAAIRAVHKRMDWLIEEFAAATQGASAPPLLVVAGARERDTGAIMALGQARLGPHVRFLVDFPRARMAELYRAADCFVLASLHEAFGIVLLEALATGLPVICHDTPGFRFVVGPSGLYGNLAAKGGLAAALATLGQVRRSLAEQARPHVERHFSRGVVTERIMDMYQTVMASE